MEPSISQLYNNEKYFSIIFTPTTHHFSYILSRCTYTLMPLKCIIKSRNSNCVSDHLKEIINSTKLFSMNSSPCKFRKPDQSKSQA